MSERYIKYAEKIISEYIEARDLAENRVLTPDEINYHMIQWMKVNDILIEESEKVEIQYNNLKEQYQIWFDSKYIEVRSRLNPIDLPSGKWAGAEEIKSFIRAENKKEYLDWKEKLNHIDCKLNKLRRIREAYKTFSFILKTLSDNMSTQMKTLNFDVIKRSDEKNFS